MALSEEVIDRIGALVSKSLDTDCPTDLAMAASELLDEVDRLGKELEPYINPPEGLEWVRGYWQKQPRVWIIENHTGPRG